MELTDAMRRCIHRPPALRPPPRLNEPNPDRPLPNAKPECDKASALGTTVQGETESILCSRVRFTGFRVRPLDPDNFAGSVKDLLDGLRHAHLIAGDEPWRLRLETEQVKVGSFKEECTVIEIFNQLSAATTQAEQK
jgi:hypothetical protein